MSNSQLSTLEECPYRVPIGTGSIADCRLLKQIAGESLSIPTQVTREACHACLGMREAEPGRINSVVASLLHAAISQFLGDPPGFASQRASAGLLREYAMQHLAFETSTGAVGVQFQGGCAESVPMQDHLRPRLLQTLVSCWNRVRTAWPKIGLIGWNTSTGLGMQNRDIAEHLPICRWLVPVHPKYDQLEPVHRVRHQTFPLYHIPDDPELQSWLDGLDWLMFVETPIFRRLTKIAKEAGIRIAAICNWEWCCLVSSDWLHDVDLLICPTFYTWQMMEEWKKRFGFKWKTVYVPWPIDIQHFPFRVRRQCRRFVFINGTGGCRGVRADGSSTNYHRKGIEVLFAAAEFVPQIPFTVFSQRKDIPAIPTNVQLMPPLQDNCELYRHGDVCIQPSHWEGLALQMLECQAAGMPLVTTNAPPMNEHNPIRTIPVADTEYVYLVGPTPVPSQVIHPKDVAEQVRQLYMSDIHDHSIRSRQFVEQHHTWHRAKQEIYAALSQSTIGL